MIEQNPHPSRADAHGPTEPTGPSSGTPAPDEERPQPPPGERPAQWWTKTPAATKTSTAADRWSLVRLAWAALVALALLVAWASGPSGSDWERQVASASQRADLNNSSAEGAPQQQVVNGWHAADLAEIQIRQGSRMLEAQARQANLLLVLGLGIFGDLALRAVERQQDRARRPGQPLGR